MMTLVGWLAMVVGAVSALGAGTLARVVWTAARGSGDRALAFGLCVGAALALALPALGLYLGGHGHRGWAWALGGGVLLVGAAFLAVLPGALSAAAQP